MKKLSEKFMVCVRCFTYNQAKYIEDAMNGFCMQRTNFPYVCVIVDDASTDGEQGVIMSYLGCHFDTGECSDLHIEETEDYKKLIARHKTNENCYFCVVFLKYNHYRKKSKLPYFHELEDVSKYLAYCEGDDFWIDIHKLKRQVDYLETHPDYTLFFHNAILRFQNHDRPDKLMSNFGSGDFDTLLLFKKWQLPLASILFRKEILEEPLYEKLCKVIHGGFCIFITATVVGKVYGLSECLSVYRKNEGGISNLMGLSNVVANHYGFAEVLQDKAVLKYVDNETLHRLIRSLPDYFRGEKSAKKLVEVVKAHNKLVFYKAMILFPLLLPLYIFRKLRRSFL